MKKVMFYCQHVLGMGHVVRSLEIVRALRDFEVYFLNGGELTPDVPIPPGVHLINLPPLQSDSEFEGLQGVDATIPLEEIQRTRLNLILDEFDRIRPDVLIVELFPFGRKRFAYELVPLLARIRLMGGTTKVVCSLRDILVSKSDQTRHEEWVVGLINRYFDLLLVHSDPKFQSLDETFSQRTSLACDLHYTGFVSQPLARPSTEPLEHLPKDPKGTPLIIVSIGGGRVGYEFVECALTTSERMNSFLSHRMVIFAGPYMPEFQFQQLQTHVNGTSHVTLQRYTSHFLAYLQKADLSISMAGYNTCMNIVSSGIRALVLPFMGRGNEEQRIRTRKLEERGIVMGLDPHKLNPDYLLEKIQVVLNRPHHPENFSLNIQGAENTSASILDIMHKEVKPAAFSSRLHASDPSDHSLSPTWIRTLQNGLERLSLTRSVIPLFLRDDDIDEDEESLRHLLDITLSRTVPMNLQIIPKTLTEGGIRVLKDFNRVNPDLVSLNQHGWSHRNHEREGRKCEFGPSRNFQEQLEDISRGKTILETIFPMRFFPVFTPPWNRCTSDTFQALDALGFHILSKDRGRQPITDFAFTEISTSLDLFTWKGGAEMKNPEDIVRLLLDQFEELPVIGILLHHKVMNTESFGFLDQLLCELNRWPNIAFYTFQTLMHTEQHLLPVGRA